MTLASLWHRWRHPDFAEKLPWRDVLDADEGIWSTTHDGLMTMFRLTPLDLATSEDAEHGAVMLRVNDAFKRLPAGWAVWLHQRRVPYTDLPPVPMPHPAAQLLFDEYRAHLSTPGRLWTNEVYLTLWRRLPKDLADAARPVFLDEPYRLQLKGAAAGLPDFRREVRRVVDVISLACRDMRQLDGTAGAAYLHSWVGLAPQPVELPDVPTDMHTYLRTCRFVPGFVPVLTDGIHTHYIQHATLHYKIPKRISGNLFRQLNTLPFGYDWVTRWVTMDPTKAESRALNTQINILSTKDGFKAQVFNRTSTRTVELANSYVEQQAKDADAAQRAMLSDEAAHGFMTVTFLVRHEDLDTATRHLDQLSGVIRRTGCLAHLDPLNGEEAYLGSIPGNIDFNVRRLEMNTHNFTVLGPWHMPSPGVPRNEHLRAPAVLQAVTDGCMPYWVNTHVGDLADKVVIGPKGSGKSTYEAAESYVGWLQYEGARVIGFDVGYSWFCVTHALGGTYYDLSAGEAQIQILHGLDDPAEYLFIYHWLLKRVAEKGVPVTPEVEKIVSGALRRLRDNPSIPRRMTSLIGCLSEHLRHADMMSNSKIDANGMSRRDARIDDLVRLIRSVSAALSAWAEGGVYGHLTDAPVDRMFVGRVHTFELEQLLEMGEACPAVLSIIFHRLAALLDGAPVRLPIGEAWVIFRIPELLAWLKDALPSWRRKNASGSFSTQSISQLINTPLTPLLYESCQVRCFLPNPQALDEESRQGYEGMRLTPSELRLLTQARPKRDMYYTRPGERRLIDVHLPPMMQAVCGSNSPQDLQVMRQLIDQYGAAEFPYRFLASRGFEAEARALMRALEGGHDEEAAAQLAHAARLDQPVAVGLPHEW